MEREDVIAAARENLKQFNLGELNYYKESTQEQFITIEKYFLEVEERINKALKEINDINFNIRGICSEINISKSTIHNNPNTLRLYIEKRIEHIEKKDVLLKNKQEKSQERMSELESFLDRAIINQIEFNNLKVHNEYLQNEINRLTNKEEVWNLERSSLIKKLNAMDLELRQLRNKKGYVITFSPDKIIE